MAALQLVLLLLLAVPPTVFTTTDIYYVTADDAAGHEQSCPPRQICHNLSYYVSQPDYYFTSNTTIIFLEGEHSLDKENFIDINNVDNLTLKGQGQWPVAGAEETVMQSTVIINCTRGRGGFHFTTSHKIAVEGLTIVNCGGINNSLTAVFHFSAVQNIFFQKNSIQHMTGYGLFAHNCENVKVSHCSYYHSALCNISDISNNRHGGGVGIMYEGTHHASYTLELSHSNMTKCCNNGPDGGGGIYLRSHESFRSATVLFSYLVFSHNKASHGGGLTVSMFGSKNVLFAIRDCRFFNGSAVSYGGGIYFFIGSPSNITIQNTELVENFSPDYAEMGVGCPSSPEWPHITFSMINSTVIHTETQVYSYYGVMISECTQVILNNTRMKFANLYSAGLYRVGNTPYSWFTLDSCQFESCRNVPSILYLIPFIATIKNCTFLNNTNGDSIITLSQSASDVQVKNSIISDNKMTGITIIESSVKFIGCNVIQNNRNTRGAGIVLSKPGNIKVEGELFLYNNTADEHGGAILVIQSLIPTIKPACTLVFVDNSSSVFFSGNRAEKGGSDMYGSTLMGCYTNYKLDLKQPDLYIPHEGYPNETSWYFDTPLKKHLKFNNTDRLSSMSSDPIMVCFCNNSNLPDCSDRAHHIQTYPGLEINTSIATVGYYGGTSPGDVLVSAQHATLVRYYGKNQTTNCFQLHILLQKTSSMTALVNIRPNGGLQSWGVSIRVDIIECPIGFTQISGQCRCEQLLADNVQCNVSLTPFKFLRSGNSWFSYINNTQCITGTTNCPYDYCNRSNVSFDIMAPGRQCVANRAGILCGQCQSHLSIMLGSNRCGTCSNWYVFLLPVFAFAGIILIAVLMFLNLSVSVGTINGLLFYANVVKLNEAFFFTNGSVPVVSQFISWLNLDLGIEVCLFDGLDGYWNTWLQFAFPVYLFLLMGGIIVGCRYSVWLCRLCGSHAVPALATLFLMSYTKILLTVTNALSMSRLPCNDSILTVWSVAKH